MSKNFTFARGVARIQRRICQLLCGLAALGTFQIPLAGCTAALEPLKIELINQTGLDVTPNLYSAADAPDATGLFGDGGNRITNFNDRPFPELRGNEIASIELGCESAGVVGISKPTLFDPATLTVTPSADEIFLVRTTDYDCGGHLRFYFYREGSALRVRVE